MTEKKLFKYSPITYFVERVFFLFQYLSIANLLFKTRTTIQQIEKSTNKEETKKIAAKRANKIEFYMITYFLILLICAFYAPFGKGLVRTLCIILPSYRIFDIFQVAVNMNIFDRIRIDSNETHVFGITRVIVLSLWNYLEIAFCFAIVYSSMLSKIHGAKSIIDAYYFSFVTQLTIGYGDLSPLGIIKLLAPLQAFIGLFFVIIVLSRIISSLPKVKSTI